MLPESPSAQVELTRDRDIAVIRINRPEKRNALTLAMLSQLRELLLQAVEADARAVILTGTADLFSAGFDLNELASGKATKLIDEEIAATALAIQSAKIPVIAAIEGACVGAAVELALACDVRIASEKTFFQVPAVRLGIVYRPEAIAMMVRLVGRETVMRLMVLAERIGGVDLTTAGLVSRTVEPGTTLEGALALADANSGSAPRAVAATKSLVTESSSEHSDLAKFDHLPLDIPEY